MSEKPEQQLLLELYLVRHGQSQGNVGYEGYQPTADDLGDPPLTAMGKKEAACLGERFADYPFDCILASPYSRATETGCAVASRQPENGCRSVELHPLFCECGITEWQGRTIAEMQKRFPLVKPAVGAEQYERFVHSDKTTEDGERQARANKMIAYLKERFQKGEKVLVAAHACFNTFLIFSALGLTTEQNFDFANGNTGVTKLLFYKEGTGKYGDTVLVYHNDQSHLYEAFKGITLDET